MDEGQVLVDHRVDRDDRRPRVGDQVPVTPEVHRRVHEGQHVGKRAGVLDRNFVPGGLQSPDDDVVEAGDNGEHRVEVLSLLVTVLSDLNRINDKNVTKTAFLRMVGLFHQFAASSNIAIKFCH